MKNAWIFVNAGRAEVVGLTRLSEFKIVLRDVPGELGAAIVAANPTREKQIPIAVTSADGSRRILVNVTGAVQVSAVATEDKPDPVPTGSFIELTGSADGSETGPSGSWFLGTAAETTLWASCVMSAKSLLGLGGMFAAPVLPIAEGLSIGSAEAPWPGGFFGSIAIGNSMLNGSSGGVFTLPPPGTEANDRILASVGMVNMSALGRRPVGVFGTPVNIADIPADYTPNLRGSQYGDLAWVLSINGASIVLAAARKIFLQQLIYSAAAPTGGDKDDFTEDSDGRNSVVFTDMAVLSEREEGPIIISATLTGTQQNLYTRMATTVANAGAFQAMWREGMLFGGTVTAEDVVARLGVFNQLSAAAIAATGNVSAGAVVAGQDLALTKGTNAEGAGAGITFSATDSNDPNNTSIGPGMANYLLISQAVSGLIDAAIIDAPEPIPTTGENGLTDETALAARVANDWDGRVIATKRLVRRMVFNTPWAGRYNRTPTLADITYDKPIGYRWLLGKDDEWVLMVGENVEGFQPGITSREAMGLYWYHVRGDAADDLIFGGDGAEAGNANTAGQLYTLAAGKNWADFVKIEINDGNIYTLADHAGEAIHYNSYAVSRSETYNESYQCGTYIPGDNAGSGGPVPNYCTRVRTRTFVDSSESSIALVGVNKFRLTAGPWSGNTSGKASGTPPVVAITKIEGYRT